MIEVDALSKEIDNEPLLRVARSALLRERAEHPVDSGHDLSHALRVAAWTIELGGEEVDQHEAILAALLHDLVAIPKGDPRRSQASELSADRARELLEEHDVPGDAVDRIAGAIREHSYSRGGDPKGALGRALQDADRLEALGSIGIARAFACGAEMGSDLFDAADPWSEGRRLDERRFSVDHFFTKLLALAPTLRTEAGRREAERRTATMQRFLVELGRELGHRYPGEIDRPKP